MNEADSRTLRLTPQRGEVGSKCARPSYSPELVCLKESFAAKDKSFAATELCWLTVRRR